MKDLAQALDKPMADTKSREERIREAAYRRYLSRDGADGDESRDWLEAEADIDAEVSAPNPDPARAGEEPPARIPK